MFGKTATLMKFEGVSCSKLQICIFFYKKPEPSCPTDPPRSISRHKLVPVEEIFCWILMSFILFNQWHYNTSLCSFGHFPNYFTKFFIANFPKVYVKLSRLLGAHFMNTSIHKILYNRKRNKMLLQKWTKLPTAYRRGGGDDLCNGYIKKKKLWDWHPGWFVFFKCQTR